ncbi:MAG: CoA transferase [Proteobacteria bacterium]|nr:CoA transferase [Pseudomonadota bacterium]
MTGALDGIRIIDMSTVILGPWAAQQLGDMGADVIKVETPDGDLTRKAGAERNEGMASFFMGANRNKRSIVLDITKSEGQEALFKLIGTADVLLHNFRPNVAKKLNMTYERFATSYPELVYCAAFGFRSDGPMATKPAYDDIIQAACGITDLQKLISDEPRFVPTIIADKTTSHYVVSAILAALLHRSKSGKGQAVEVPMFESLVDFMMVEHLGGEGFVPPTGPMGYARLLNKERRPYATKDGYLAVLPYTDANWEAMFKISGRDELRDDPRFANHSARIKNSGDIYHILADIVATKTTAEWLDALEKAAVPVQAVHSFEDLIDNEQLVSTGFWQTAEHPTEGTLRYPEPPVRFSESPSSVRRLQPRLGEHSAEVLTEVGYSETEISDLFDKGVSKTVDSQ